MGSTEPMYSIQQTCLQRVISHTDPAARIRYLGAIQAHMGDDLLESNSGRGSASGDRLDVLHYAAHGG